VHTPPAISTAIHSSFDSCEPRGGEARNLTFIFAENKPGDLVPSKTKRREREPEKTEGKPAKATVDGVRSPNGSRSAAKPEPNRIEWRQLRKHDHNEFEIDLAPPDQQLNVLRGPPRMHRPCILTSGVPMPESPDPSILNTLSHTQQEVLRGLVAGLSISAAARAAGVLRATVHLWFRTAPTFSRALDAHRRLRADRIADDLNDLADSALLALKHILDDAQSPTAVRYRAVRKKATSIAKPISSPTTRTGPVRNPSCPCGSRLEYKRCCGALAPQTRPIQTRRDSTLLDSFYAEIQNRIVER
jgi:hypothetical protein